MTDKKLKLGAADAWATPTTASSQTPSKDRIIDALDIMRRRDYAEKRVFQARAYDSAIKALRGIAGDITDVTQVKGVKGIGEKIQTKIAEILETGALAAAERTRADPTFAAYEALLGVYGIGPAKAKVLVDSGILSIDALREAAAKNTGLLTAAQAVGLRYYEQLLERIPRSEMAEHEAFLLSNLDPLFKPKIVGSYRRGAETSGDIDVLMTLPDDVKVLKRAQYFKKAIATLLGKGYMTEILASGPTKCLAICKLPGGVARRLDLLLIPYREYPWAVLYFTGSDLFNIAFRSHALEKGYTMNEHGATPTGEKSEPPLMTSEEDIFDFFGLQYVEPRLRRGALDVVTQ